MFDFWAGMSSVIVAAGIAEWMSRLKYWVIFLVATLAIHVGAFVQDWLGTNFLSALNRSVTFAFTAVGFFAPMAVGLLAVFIAFVGSANAPKKDDKSESEKK